MSSKEPNAPARPDREPPDPDEVARIEDDDDLLDADEIDEAENELGGEPLNGLDKTLADSFPASDPPQAP